MKRLAFLLALLCVPVAAHEIGTSHVNAELRKDHTYRIDVVTAPQSLVNKLEGRTKQRLSMELPPGALRARLQAFAPELAKAADIRFGDVRVTPQVTVLPIGGEPATVIVRFSGDVPVRAGPFTWSYDLIYSTYAFNVDGRRMWLDADARSAPVPVGAHIAMPTRGEVIRQYLVLGFTHIVPLGLDHILFVLGMFLLTPRVKAVLTQVTAFTVAHSITLGLTMYGLVALSPRIVEPLIALSIAWVAVENLTTTKLRPWRVAVVFAFGLLHGMGFAGVLSELGLPRAEFVPALISFNAGVECGQLLVIAAAWLLVVSWAERRAWYRPRVVVPASMAIALTGLIWTVQRFLG